MSDLAQERLRPLAPGIVLALLAIAFGFGMGAAFGAAEDTLKDGLQQRGLAVLETTYANDEAALSKVVSKSWSYYKRAHLHGTALGTAALSCILLIACLGQPALLEKLAAAAFGSGALVYGVYWLLAGMSAPGLGSTGAAKEALAFVAIPGSGLCMIGLALTLYLVVSRLLLSGSGGDGAESSSA